MLESNGRPVKDKTLKILKDDLLAGGFIWPRSGNTEYSNLAGEPEGEMIFCVQPQDKTKAPQFGSLDEMISCVTGTENQIIPVVDQFGVPRRAATMDQIESIAGNF